MKNKNIPAVMTAILLLTLPGYTLAQESTEDVYDSAVSKFWDNIYLTGGWTLYCGYKFDHARKTADGKTVVIEQIYPALWMVKYLNCKSRMDCIQSSNNGFNRMESDLHNMYPVWATISWSRGNTRYGLIEGEDWRIDGCDFERKNGITEPRPIARGNIARAIFYMGKEYGLPVDENMLTILRRWNRDDPPSEQEKQRNNRIQELQGNRNPFIDNPALADKMNLGRPDN